MTLLQKEFCVRAPLCSAPTAKPRRDRGTYKPHGPNQPRRRGKAVSRPGTGITGPGGKKKKENQKNHQNKPNQKDLKEIRVYSYQQCSAEVLSAWWGGWGGQGRTLEANVWCHFPGKAKYATEWQNWIFRGELLHFLDLNKRLNPSTKTPQSLSKIPGLPRAKEGKLL